MRHREAIPNNPEAITAEALSSPPLPEQAPRLKTTWQAAAYDKARGEWVHTELHAYEHGNRKEELANLLVRNAPPVELPPKPTAKRKRTKEIRTVVGGDAQFPFADPGAVTRFLKLVELAQPDEVGLVGDMTDFPALSKFAQRREWVGSTQASIDQYGLFLTQLRLAAPNARIFAVHGNHEQRLINALERNLSEVAGLRRAMGNRALLSVQHLARYEELEIESIDGYPNGTLWLEDNLKVVHGTNVAKGGSNAAKYLATEPESTIYGHAHRQEIAYRTIPRRLGHAVIAAASPGCLAHIDGTVPSFNHTPTADGEVVKKTENWQQGALFVARKALHHTIEPVLFTSQGFRYEGKSYE